MESLWKAKKYREFYAESQRIADDAERAAEQGKDVVDIALSTLEAMVTKDLDVKKIVAKSTKRDGPVLHTGDDIKIVETLWVLFIANSGDPSMFRGTLTQRQQAARFFAKFLGKIRAERIPNYRHIMLYWTPESFSGIPPKEITDLAKRAKYEAALNDPADVNIMNSRQADLANAEQFFSKALLWYLAETFREAPSSPKLSQCVKDAQLTKEEQKKLEGKLREPSEPSEEPDDSDSN